MINTTRLGRIARQRARAYQRLATIFSPPGQDSSCRHSREYTDLFVAPRPRVYPYESMYRGQPPRVMGDSTLDVVRHYRRAGFPIPPGWHDLPDHVALELAFMGVLAENEAARWDEGADSEARAMAHVARAFAEDHLLRWLPEFCEAVCKASHRGRLERAAQRLRWVILRDHDWLVAVTTEGAVDG